MPCNASYTRFIFGKVFRMYCKLICILYALLCGQNFILVKSGCYIRTRGSVSRRAVDCVESPFSREQLDLSKSVGASWKVATYGDHPQEAYVGHTWTGVESVRVVLVGFSPAGCTSIQIASTLGYEWPLVWGSLLVANLMAWLMV
jgi:hypothetical protein